MSIPLKTDEVGNAIMYPLTGWELRPVADIELMIGIEYAETPEQYQTAERRTFQVVLYPEQAAKLAEDLKSAVTSLLVPKSATIQ
jgi:hypothetical protein